MNFITNLQKPAKIFLYLSILSLIIYVIQSASFMHMGIMKILINKILMIVIWTYLLNLVAKDGQHAYGIAWLLSLWCFMPSSLGFMFA